MGMTVLRIFDTKRFAHCHCHCPSRHFLGENFLGNDSSLRNFCIMQVLGKIFLGNDTKSYSISHIRTWLRKGMLFRETVEFPSELDLIWGIAVEETGSRDDESGLSFIDWNKLLSRVVSTIPEPNCGQTPIWDCCVCVDKGSIVVSKGP